MSARDAWALQDALSVRDLCVAWDAWSSLPQGALIDAEFVRARGSASFKRVCLGGPKIKKTRLDTAEARCP